MRKKKLEILINVYTDVDNRESAKNEKQRRRISLKGQHENYVVR